MIPAVFIMCETHTFNIYLYKIETEYFGREQNLYFLTYCVQ